MTPELDRCETHVFVQRVGACVRASLLARARAGAVVSAPGRPGCKCRTMRAIITNQPSCEVTQIDATRRGDQSFTLRRVSVWRVGVAHSVLEERLRIDLAQPAERIANRRRSTT